MARKDRKEGLLKLMGDNSALYCDLVEQFCFIEDELKKVRKLPFITVADFDKSIQKETPASKYYKDLLGQYFNIAKMFESVMPEGMQESPFRNYLKDSNLVQKIKKEKIIPDEDIKGDGNKFDGYN